MWKLAASIVVIGLVGGGVCPAGVGDLTFVPSPAGEGLSGPACAYSSEFTKPAQGTGTVNPRAVIGKLQLGDQTVWAAVDTEDPNGATADTIRLDFSGQGTFQKAMSLPLKALNTPPGSDYFSARLGPGTLQLKREGGTVPVTVSGYYHKSSSSRQLTLYVGLAAEGECAFGDKTYKVRIVDGNGNFRLNDAAQPPGGLIVNRPAQAGDTVIAQVGQESRRYYYGQPIFLDGTWYELTVSPDAAKVTARAADIPAGKLLVAHPHWSGQLAGEKGMFAVYGGKDPTPLPAGKYTLSLLQMQADEGGKPGRASMTCASGATPVTVEVAAGKVAELKVGPPMTAVASARILGSMGSMVQLDLTITGAAGEPVQNVRDSQGAAAPLPRLTIRDAEGKTIHSGQFEYG